MGIGATCQEYSFVSIVCQRSSEAMAFLPMDPVVMARHTVPPLNIPAHHCLFFPVSLCTVKLNVVHGNLLFLSPLPSPHSSTVGFRGKKKEGKTIFAWDRVHLLYWGLRRAFTS